MFWHRLEEFSNYKGAEQIHKRDQRKNAVAVNAGLYLIRITDRELDNHGVSILQQKLKNFKNG